MNTGCGPLAEAGGFSFARPRVAASVALMRCERWGREVWRGCCEEGVDDFRDAVEAVEDLQAEANGLGFLFWGHGGVQPGLMKTRAPRDVRERAASLTEIYAGSVAQWAELRPPGSRSADCLTCVVAGSSLHC